MHLISLQIGLPQTRKSSLIDGLESQWMSSIWKAPITERLPLDQLNLAGDRQADLQNHGGPDKAICCYATEHSPGWREMLDKSASHFPYGAFGENFTLAGMTEETVCIGDSYAIGTARVEISQPRMPCWKLGRRWELPTLPLAVQTSGKTGYYLRVLEPGEVGAGDSLLLQDRPLPDWTIARVNHAMYVAKNDIGLAAELSELSLLADAWRRPFRRRAGLI